MTEQNTTKRPKKTTNVKGTASSVIDVSRNIKAPVQLLLFVRAGGRCEFDGCNKYLIEHHLTHRRGNFAQMAHIVAFSKIGPRGDVLNRPEKINDIENLMLLCHSCHKLIDDAPAEHPREMLEAHKKAHEDRILLLTGTAPDRQTTAVTLRSKIGGKNNKISPAEINAAVAPRYAATREGFDIDLTSIQDEGSDFYKVAARKVELDLRRIVESTMNADQTNHLSMFPLAPMPLLILAGNVLGDKVPCDLYQKHRDTQDWTWKKDGEPIRYKVNTLTKGKDRKKVALVLSLSGTIAIDTLPADVVAEATVYEITLDDGDPHPGFLRQDLDLRNFREIYQRTLRTIGTKHGKIDRLHLFPAVPAPVAVTCGRELMPKIDPTVAVYDDDKRHGGFQKILEVNN